MATLKEDAMVIAGIGLGVVLLAWYAKYKVGKALDKLPDLPPEIDPRSDQNYAYTSVNSFLRLLGMDKGETLGTAAYGYVHKTDIAPDGTMPNYTKAQQDADYKAMLQIQNGYHGL